MEHITVGKKYNEGKVAFVECLTNDDLQNIDIKDKYFLLICLTSGSISFKINEEIVYASAPCFICFNEKENPKLISKYNAKYYCIYFHPQFLNINMTFKLLRSRKYSDIATNHDMFLLKPFLDGYYVISICDNYLSSVETACIHMQKELKDQRDWYWSCRGRSYFMEIIIALERMYGLMGYGEKDKNIDTVPTIKNAKLREAVLFIEGHYREDISLSDISNTAKINHTTLTKLLKQELGVTAMEYLTNYRIKVAKKQLAFTEIPIKDVSKRSGFKTVQHFSRIFKEQTGTTPAAFRKNTVKKRKEEITDI